MNLDTYSEVFKKLLLRNVIIKCGTKTYRSGKIKNFDIKQFYIKLFIENNKQNIKLLELPYPFEISYTPEKTTLNYHTSAFYNRDNDLSLKIKLLSTKEASKFFNNNVEIIPVEY